MLRVPSRGSGFPLSVALLSAVFLLHLSGCGSSTGTMRKKLDKIGMDDLKDILAEIPAQARQARLAQPYFKIESYREFHGDTSVVFQAMATLYFFYLDPSLGLCQMRKYRYKRTSAMWDRYEVKLVHIPEKFSGKEPE